MNCQQFETTRQMIDVNIDPFEVMERKLVYGFRKRVLDCMNDVVACIAQSNFFYTSALYKRWNKILL